MLIGIVVQDKIDVALISRTADAPGHNNWLFAGFLRTGKRAAAVMRLVRSARFDGHDPYAYLKEVLTRLFMQPAMRIGELMSRNWAVQRAN